MRLHSRTMVTKVSLVAWLADDRLILSGKYGGKMDIELLLFWGWDEILL